MNYHTKARVDGLVWYTTKRSWSFSSFLHDHRSMINVYREYLIEVLLPIWGFVAFACLGPSLSWPAAFSQSNTTFRTPS